MLGLGGLTEVAHMRALFQVLNSTCPRTQADAYIGAVLARHGRRRTALSRFSPVTVGWLASAPALQP